MTSDEHPALTPENVARIIPTAAYLREHGEPWGDEIEVARTEVIDHVARRLDEGHVELLRVASVGHDLAPEVSDFLSDFGAALYWCVLALAQLATQNGDPVLLNEETAEMLAEGWITSARRRAAFAEFAGRLRGGDDRR